MTTCPIGPTCTGCAKCDPEYHAKRAAKRALQLRTNKEKPMTDYAPPDSYAPSISALRAANATPASRFEEQYKADRLREIDEQHAAWAAKPKPKPLRALTAAELAASVPPNPYASLKEPR
jgi:hypothetical protein